VKACSLVVDARPVGVRVMVAGSARERMRGLLGRAVLDPCDALLLPCCGSVHTFGMQFPIDVMFVDRCDRVVAVHRGVRRARVLAHWRASKTLEMAAGSAAVHGITVGVQLAWEAA
jgi:uncharacterized membrane protein (UPF0127 family)